MSNRKPPRDAFSERVDKLLGDGHTAPDAGLPASTGGTPPTAADQADRYVDALATLAAERAPESLRARLEQLSPPVDIAPHRASRWRPAWAAIAAAAMITAYIGLHNTDEQRTRDIARGKRELAFALAQLDKATSKMSHQIQFRLDNNVNAPVTGRLASVIDRQLDLEKE
jgi:hypothetical protein